MVSKQANGGELNGIETCVENLLQKADTNSGYVKDSNFKNKFINNKEYRTKFLYTVLIWILHLVFGWKIAQTGPSLLDLQFITNTSLDKISVIFTVDSTGYFVGTFLSGYLFRKFNSAILFSISAVGSALTIAVIPWCSVYEVMVIVFAIKGIFYAFVDTISNAELFRIWKTNNAVIIQTLHFFFTIGAALTPTVTAPFLMPSSADDTGNVAHLTNGVNFQQNTTTNIKEHFGNCSFVNETEDSCLIKQTIEGESRLHIAYLITAILYVLPGVIFIYSYFKIDVAFFKHAKNNCDKDDEKAQKPAFRYKLVVYIIVACMSSTYFIFDDSLFGFLSAFCVEQLKWTKSSASHLTSVYWTTFAIGRFLSIFLMNYFKSSHLLGITSSLLIIAYIGILLSSLYLYNPGLWISIGLSGFSMSSMFPTIFTWTDNEMFSVTGFLTSLIFAAGASMAIINPVILGYLMENITKMAFCYIILAGAISFVMVFTVGVIFSKKYGHVYLNTKTIEVVIPSDEKMKENKNDPCKRVSVAL